MISGSIHSKALDKANSTMRVANRFGLNGYSILSYAIFGQHHSHGWTFTRKGSIEVIRVEPEALEQLYPDRMIGSDASPI
jgi:hypothetical protein